MISLTNLEKTPNIAVLCDCNRLFIQEEMYCCLYCNYSMCRYCTPQEIMAFFCKNCLRNPSSNETFSFKNTCGNCVECPICKNILTITISSETQKLFFYCQFCFWDSKSIGLVEDKFEDISTACANKNKDIIDPKSTEFSRLKDIYKQSENEIEKEKKLYMRIKRKSISLVLPSIISRDVSKKTWTQFEFEREVQMKSELLLRKQYVLEKNNCKSFKLDKNKNEEDNIFIKTAEIYKDLYDESYPKLVDELATNFDHNTVTNFEQRISFPIIQPYYTNTLAPKPLTMITKRSKKCRKCMKYVVKLEKSNSIFTEYKQCYYLIEHSPKITIKSIKKSGENNESLDVILNFLNNTRCNILVYLDDNLSESITDKLNLFECSIVENYEFKMESIDAIDKSKKDEPSSAELEKKTPGLREIDKKKISVPIRIDLESRKNCDIIKFGIKIQLKIEMEHEHEFKPLSYIIIINIGKIK